MNLYEVILPDKYSVCMHIKIGTDHWYLAQLPDESSFRSTASMIGSYRVSY